MNPNLTKREYLRNKREEQKRKQSLLMIVIILGILSLFSLAILIPKLLMKQPKYQDSQGFVMGNPQAPVSVTQFSSYYCSHCKTFSEAVEPDFIKTYVNTGKVYYRYIIVSANDESSIIASEASHCAAEQNRFFEYKEVLYRYSAEPDGFSMNNLVKFASTVGMDKEKFLECMQSGLYTSAYLKDREIALTPGVTGTPMFLVNGQLVYANGLYTAVESALNQ